MSEMPMVNGTCPSCGMRTMTLHNFAVHCSNPECPEPDAVDVILNDPDIDLHRVVLEDGGFSMVHPLIERMHDLRDCELHRLVGIVSDAGKGWRMHKDDDEVLEHGLYRVTRAPADHPHVGYLWEPA